MRRRRPPPDNPPPIGGIVIDGANVIASSGARPVQRIDLAVAWAQHWREDLPVAVFVDHSTWRRCRPDARRELEQRAVICKPGTEADVPVLHAARERTALILSNDRFWDHVELRTGVFTVQFVLEKLELRVYAEATWFPSAHGAAQRVSMDDLRARR